jgi:hypothetical protein
MTKEDKYIHCLNNLCEVTREITTLLNNYYLHDDVRKRLDKTLDELIETNLLLTTIDMYK